VTVIEEIAAEREHMQAATKRFMGKVKKGESCWLWSGRRNNHGYGQLRFRNKQWVASRFAWLIFKGPIPAGMCVLHRCDVPACVNPDHLFLGSHADNMRDMKKKGRGRDATGEANSRAKLKEADVRAIRVLKGQVSYAQIAEKFGVSSGMVSMIVNRQNWGHLE
jgi:hypothetical protein